MAEYKEEVLKKVMLNLSVDHHEYLQSLNNASKVMRWLINNYPGYIKYMKEKDE